MTHLTTVAKVANADFSEFRDLTTVILVLLSAELHPEGNNGQDRVEVIVKTIGPASNWYRGRLVMTPMKARDSGSGGVRRGSRAHRFGYTNNRYCQSWIDQCAQQSRSRDKLPQLKLSDVVAK